MRSYEITDVPEADDSVEEHFMSFFDEDGAVIAHLELPISYACAEKIGELWVSDGQRIATANPIGSTNSSDVPVPALELRPSEEFMKGPGE